MGVDAIPASATALAAELWRLLQDARVASIAVAAALLGALVAGTLLAAWWRRWQRQQLTRLADERALAGNALALERRLLAEREGGWIRELRRAETRADEIAPLRTALAQALQEHAAADARASEARVRVADANEVLRQERARGDALQRALSTTTAQVGELTSRLNLEARHFKQREQAYRDQGEALSARFETLANRIFDDKGVQQEGRLNEMLTPLREQMADFRTKVEEVYVADTRERASLLGEVRNLQRASERINKEADQLARALKGDTRVQGNWGELVLERILEEAGLRKGSEYETQISLRDPRGDRRRPDVIVHLPDGKDVVIDAKVSLSAYERASSATDPAVVASHLRQLVTDLKTQVRRLARQDYSLLEGLRSLDFILLFVPVEPAFHHALRLEPKLFTDAFAQRIMMVSPTTLLMSLKIIQNLWRYEHQREHAQQLARQAGALYDKLRGVVTDVEKLGVQLGTVQKTYDAAVGKLWTGRGNLVGRVEEFKHLGADTRQDIPAHLVRLAAAADDAANPLGPTTDNGVHGSAAPALGGAMDDPSPPPADPPAEPLPGNEQPEVGERDSRATVETAASEPVEALDALSERANHRPAEDEANTDRARDTAGRG